MVEILKSRPSIGGGDVSTTYTDEEGKKVTVKGKAPAKSGVKRRVTIQENGETKKEVLKTTPIKETKGVKKVTKQFVQRGRNVVEITRTDYTDGRIKINEKVVKKLGVNQRLKNGKTGEVQVYSGLKTAIMKERLVAGASSTKPEQYESEAKPTLTAKIYSRDSQTETNIASDLSKENILSAEKFIASHRIVSPNMTGNLTVEQSMSKGLLEAKQLPSGELIYGRKVTDTEDLILRNVGLSFVRTPIALTEFAKAAPVVAATVFAKSLTQRPSETIAGAIAGAGLVYEGIKTKAKAIAEYPETVGARFWSDVALSSLASGVAFKEGRKILGSIGKKVDNLLFTQPQPKTIIGSQSSALVYKTSSDNIAGIVSTTATGVKGDFNINAKQIARFVSDTSDDFAQGQAKVTVSVSKGGVIYPDIDIKTRFSQFVLGKTDDITDIHVRTGMQVIYEPAQQTLFMASDKATSTLTFSYKGLELGKETFQAGDYAVRTTIKPLKISFDGARLSEQDFTGIGYTVKGFEPPTELYSFGQTKILSFQDKAPKALESFADKFNLPDAAGSVTKVNIGTKMASVAGVSAEQVVKDIAAKLPDVSAQAAPAVAQSAGSASIVGAVIGAGGVAEASGMNAFVLPSPQIQQPPQPTMEINIPLPAQPVSQEIGVGITDISAQTPAQTTGQVITQPQMPAQPQAQPSGTTQVTIPAQPQMPDIAQTPAQTTGQPQAQVVLGAPAPAIPTLVLGFPEPGLSLGFPVGGALPSLDVGGRSAGGFGVPAFGFSLGRSYRPSLTGVMGGEQTFDTPKLDALTPFDTRIPKMRWDI